MADVFCFGARPKDSLSRRFEELGGRIIHARCKKHALGSSPTCAAVVVHWKSNRDQRIVQEAKAAGIPVLVITSKLAAAYQAGKPFADVYLEDPVSDDEVATLLIDLATVKSQQSRVAAPVGVSLNPNITSDAPQCALF